MRPVCVVTMWGWLRVEPLARGTTADTEGRQGDASLKIQSRLPSERMHLMQTTDQGAAASLLQISREPAQPRTNPCPERAIEFGRILHGARDCCLARRQQRSRDARRDVSDFGQVLRADEREKRETIEGGTVN
jgi:hypothetical protein